MLIKYRFKDPKEVSQGYKPDILKMRVNNGSEVFFESFKSGNIIKNDEDMIFEIP